VQHTGRVPAKRARGSDAFVSAVVWESEWDDSDDGDAGLFLSLSIIYIYLLAYIHIYLSVYLSFYLSIHSSV